jgi:pimeloyl-ACP methyl ester carboxylesterase
MTAASSHYVVVDGAKTHFLHAGKGFPLVLLHSGEFGACAELSWERNIEALSEHFEVFAPDWLGFGMTAKIFSFEDMWDLRVRHITSFLRTVCVEGAHFIGNSMGGTVLLATAALCPSPWPMEKIVVVSGGGTIPDNEGRKILNSYDGSLDHMRRIVETMFVDPAIVADEAYIARRHRKSLEEGAWECTAAVRFKAPWREPSQMPTPPDYSRVSAQTLLVTGAQDRLREPGFGQKLQALVPRSRLHVIAQAGHCSQIDAPEEFNRAVISFLKG